MYKISDSNFCNRVKSASKIIQNDTNIVIELYSFWIKNRLLNFRVGEIVGVPVVQKSKFSPEILEFVVDIGVIFNDFQR